MESERRGASPGRFDRDGGGIIIVQNMFDEFLSGYKARRYSQTEVGFTQKAPRPSLQLAPDATFAATFRIAPQRPGFAEWLSQKQRLSQCFALSYVSRQH